MRAFHFIKPGLVLSIVTLLGSIAIGEWLQWNALDFYPRFHQTEPAPPADPSVMTALPTEELLIWQQLQHRPPYLMVMAAASLLIILLLVLLNPNIRQVQIGAWCAGGGTFLYFLSYCLTLHQTLELPPTSISSIPPQWLSIPAILCYAISILLCLKSLLTYQED